MVADGFIQVHAVANGRVKAGEQLGGYYEDFQRVAGVAVALEHELLQAGLRVYGLPALEGDWVKRQTELAPAAYYLVQTKAPLLTVAKICSLRRFDELSARMLLSQIGDFTILHRIQLLRHTVVVIVCVKLFCSNIYTPRASQCQLNFNSITNLMNNYHKTLLTILLTYSASVYSVDFQDGLDAYNSGDYVAALEEWRPLAEQGDAAAQNNLGLMYRNGRGVSQDHEQAVYWFRLATEQGNANAQLSLGVSYHNGLGV